MFYGDIDVTVEVYNECGQNFKSEPSTVSMEMKKTLSTGIFATDVNTFTTPIASSCPSNSTSPIISHTPLVMTPTPTNSTRGKPLIKIVIVYNYIS